MLRPEGGGACRWINVRRLSACRLDDSAEHSSDAKLQVALVEICFPGATTPSESTARLGVHCDILGRAFYIGEYFFAPPSATLRETPPAFWNKLQILPGENTRTGEKVPPCSPTRRGHVSTARIEIPISFYSYLSSDTLSHFGGPLSSASFEQRYTAGCVVVKLYPTRYLPEPLIALKH